MKEVQMNIMKKAEFSQTKANLEIVRNSLPRSKNDAISIIEIQNRTGLGYFDVFDALKSLKRNGVPVCDAKTRALEINKYYLGNTVEYGENIQKNVLKHKLGMETDLEFR